MLTTALGGCHAGFKSAAGSATSPSGMGPTLSRSLQFSDEGLLLSRLGLGLLGMGAAVGSIEKTAIVEDENGDLWQVATINKDRAKKAQDVLDLANEGKLSSATGGIAARLQIAAQTLGGDTSGWQYDMGYNIRAIRSIGPIATLLRAYVGVGYGSFTMHDVLVRTDRGPPEMRSADYDFFGVYARGGAFLIKNPTSFKDVAGLETFATVSGNALGASTFGLGERLQLTLLFVEVEAQQGSEGRTYSIEVGGGF